jgi:hypothetical protein
MALPISVSMAPGIRQIDHVSSFPDSPYVRSWTWRGDRYGTSRLPRLLHPPSPRNHRSFRRALPAHPGLRQRPAFYQAGRGFIDRSPSLFGTPNSGGLQTDVRAGGVKTYSRILERCQDRAVRSPYPRLLSRAGLRRNGSTCAYARVHDSAAAVSRANSAMTVQVHDQTLASPPNDEETECGIGAPACRGDMSPEFQIPEYVGPEFR